MLKAVFFDLDGTLLPLDEQKFIEIYVSELVKKFVPLGYDKNKILDFSQKSIIAMFNNDGSKTNEEVYRDVYKDIFGKYDDNDVNHILDFHQNEFFKTKEACGYNPLAKEIVKFVKDNNLLSVLSTNPVFQKTCTISRMGFTDLIESDFDYITTYENSRFCKPNPNYFIDLLNKFNLKSDEVIVFGNNTYEDGECSLGANIKCYLIKDYLIRHPKAKHEFEIIEMHEVIDKIKEWLCR
jgi:FMN phosphatase YigB (HAD superfamily)